MTKETRVDAEVAASGCEQSAKLAHDNEAAVLAVRNLVFDLCTRYGGGHGGSALGMLQSEWLFGNMLCATTQPSLSGLTGTVLCCLMASY